MRTVTVTFARSNLHRLIDAVLIDQQPIQITADRGNAVLIAETEWRTVQETLFLISIPGIRESILAGMAEPVEGCDTEIDL